VLAFLGSIGTPELIVILIVALLVFGRRLPEVMRNLGKSVNEFKKGMNEVQDSVLNSPPEGDKSAPPAAGHRDVSAPPEAPQQKTL
jgi:TatA/E family protein of Tat protein translocase